MIQRERERESGLHHFRLNRPRQKLAFLAFIVVPWSVYVAIRLELQFRLESSWTSVERFVAFLSNALMFNHFPVVFMLSIFVYGSLIDCLRNLLRSLRDPSSKEQCNEPLLLVGFDWQGINQLRNPSNFFAKRSSSAPIVITESNHCSAQLTDSLFPGGFSISQLKLVSTRGLRDDPYVSLHLGTEQKISLSGSELNNLGLHGNIHLRHSDLVTQIKRSGELIKLDL